MLALSTKQPWAQLIICGLKPIEIRTKMPKRALGLRIFIHASKQIDKYAPKEVWRMVPEEYIDNNGDYILPTGELIGTAVLENAYQYHGDLGKWKAEQHLHLNPIEWLRFNSCALVFAYPELLKEPIPYKGQLGFFEVKG